jgi:hypothetical protein
MMIFIKIPVVSFIESIKAQYRSDYLRQFWQTKDLSWHFDGPGLKLPAFWLTVRKSG